MTADFTTSYAIGSSLALVLTSAAAFVERRKNDNKKDRQTLLDAKDELIRVKTESLDAWKQRFETQNKEFSEYRTDVHKRLNDASATVLRYTTENQELRARTDVTPLLEHQRLQTIQWAEQTEINKQILGSLKLLQEQLRPS